MSELPSMTEMKVKYKLIIMLLAVICSQSSELHFGVICHNININTFFGVCFPPILAIAHAAGLVPTLKMLSLFTSPQTSCFSWHMPPSLVRPTNIYFALFCSEKD